jgi:hypothetical protein
VKSKRGRINRGSGKKGNKAKKETKVEIGAVPRDLKRMGILRFQFKGEPEILEVHVFSCSDFEGEIKETEEMKPRWFKIEEIPFDQMWPDDKYWLPLLLEEKILEENSILKVEN